MSLVLLVEDDLDLATTVVDYLELENMQCDHAANGVAGLQLIKQQQLTQPYDAIVLDVNMPQMDGLTMCQKMREQGINTPVIMLTARDTLTDKLSGFNVGVDDYMVKPFEMLELVARLKALTHRRSGLINKLSLCGVTVDFALKTASRNHRTLHFSPTGWKLLEILMRNSPEILSREQLVRAIWGDDAPDSNSLKVHLFKLRQQIDPQGDNQETIRHTSDIAFKDEKEHSEPKLIHTISGKGVTFGERSSNE